MPKSDEFFNDAVSELLEHAAGKPALLLYAAAACIHQAGEDDPRLACHQPGLIVSLQNAQHTHAIDLYLPDEWTLFIVGK